MKTLNYDLRCNGGWTRQKGTGVADAMCRFVKANPGAHIDGVFLGEPGLYDGRIHWGADELPKVQTAPLRRQRFEDKTIPFEFYGSRKGC